MRSQEMAARISDATEQTAQTARVASYELSDSLETMRSIMASTTNCNFRGLNLVGGQTEAQRRKSSFFERCCSDNTGPRMQLALTP